MSAIAYFGDLAGLNEKFGLDEEWRRRMVDATYAALERGEEMPEQRHEGDRIIEHLGRRYRVRCWQFRTPDWMRDVDPTLSPEAYLMVTAGRAGYPIIACGVGLEDTTRHLLAGIERDDEMFRPRGEG